MGEGESGGGCGRPSEWYRAASCAEVRGAAPSAARHWKAGAGCHMLPAGVGGLRLEPSPEDDEDDDSKK